MTIILVGVEHPGNLGAIARLMRNFEEEELVLVRPQALPTDEEALNRSKHGKTVLEKATIMDWEQVVDQFDILIALSARTGSDYNLARTPLTPHDVVESLRDKHGRIGFVFGPEPCGLSNQEIKDCDMFVHIPTNQEYPALNLSHAVGIILYEINRKRLQTHIELPSRQELDVVKEKIDLICERLEWTTEEKKETQQLLWPRIFSKSFLSKRETFTLIGFLEKIRRKL